MPGLIKQVNSDNIPVFWSGLNASVASNDATPFAQFVGLVDSTGTQYANLPLNLTQIGGSAHGLTNPLFISPATGATFAISNFPATQAVSLASLPSLPSGTNTIGAISNASFSVSNFPSTQAVSIATLPPLPTGTNAIGTVGITALPALPTGANTIGAISNTGFASTQSGTWSLTNISGTVSLPTGA